MEKIPMDILNVFDVKVVPNVSNEPVTVQPDFIYEFVCDMSARSGVTHKNGDTIKVIEATQATPHNEIGISGCNWICETKHGRSVWSSLEHCISRGMIRRLKQS
jgi:hypothetical protein